MTTASFTKAGYALKDAAVPGIGVVSFGPNQPYATGPVTIYKYSPTSETLVPASARHRDPDRPSPPRSRAMCARTLGGAGTGIGRSMSEPTVGGPASPGASEDMSAADLAHLVVDSAAERQLAAESMPEFLFPEDMLPGAGRSRPPCARGCALRAHGLHRPGHHRHAGQPPELRAGRPGSQHPIVVPRLDRRHHLRGGRLGRIPRPGHPADGLVGRPLPAPADHRLGHPRVRADGVATGFATNIFVFFLARFGAGVSQSSTYSVHGSLLADTYPINLRGRIYAAMGMGQGLATGRQSPPGRSHRQRGRRSQRVALGLLHPGRSHCSWRSSPSASPSPPGGSTRRRTSSGRSSATPRRPHPRSRPPSSGSCGSARSRRS